MQYLVSVSRQKDTPEGLFYGHCGSELLRLRGRPFSAFDYTIRRLEWTGARGALPVRGKGRAHPTDAKATNLLSCLISGGLQARHERRFACPPENCPTDRTSINTRSKRRSSSRRRRPVTRAHSSSCANIIRG